MHYLRTLTFLVIGYFSTVGGLLAQSAINAGSSASSGGKLKATVGQVFYTTGRSCGGRIQDGILAGDLPMLDRQSSLQATDKASDAYITVSWELVEECFKQLDNNCRPYPDGVLLKLLADEEEVFSDIIYNAEGSQIDNFRHFVGPDASVDYELKLYVRGSGDEPGLCTNLSATGTTSAYQAPVDLEPSQNTYPDRIELSWKNKSQLGTELFLYRKAGEDEKVLIESIPGTEKVDSVYTFTDAYQAGADQNLVNGESYTYCVETYNEELDVIFNDPQSCTSASTQGINFTANVATNAGIETVTLNWEDLSSFGSQINVYRDDNLIATLQADELTYQDNSPTYGKQSLYRLDLLDAQGLVKVRTSTSVNLDAIGRLAGFIRTPDNVGIPMEEAVSYTAQVGGDTIQGTADTDDRGYYVFDALPFDRQAVFTVEVLGSDQFSFTESIKQDTLSNATHESLDINFTSDEGYPETENENNELLSLTSVESQAGTDELTFTWAYSASSELETPIHFQLYRENELIGITDDAQTPLEFIDRSGNAEQAYQYELVAYGFIDETVVRVTEELMVNMPAVTPPYGLEVVYDFDDESDDVNTLMWQHDSDNFDGFRLRRGGELVAELEPSARTFKDYYAPPDMVHDYTLVAFRKNTGITAMNDPEETSAPAMAASSPVPLPSVEGLMAEMITERNAVRLSWSLPQEAGKFDALAGFVVIRNDSLIKYVPKKADQYSYDDERGMPGENMTYSVKPCLITPDKTHFGAPNNVDITYPSPTAPSITVDASNSGYATVSIDEAYLQNNSNFDGFECSANQVPFDTLIPCEGTTTYFVPESDYGDIEITVAAFRVVGGQFRYGDETTQMVNMTESTGAIEAPSSFQASRHIPKHVALHWEYPEYIFAEFEIIRDETPIDTVSRSTRYYYDRAIEPGERHLYAIRAIYDVDKSRKTYTVGARKGGDYLQGQIQPQDRRAAIDSVLVELRGKNNNALVQRAFTDSAGYFRFDHLCTDIVNGDLQVVVLDEQHDPIELSDNTFQIEEQAPIFLTEVTSVATVPPPPRADSTAAIKSLNIQPIASRSAAVVSWSFTEGQVEGAAVKRGLTDLVTAETEEAAFIVDVNGVGGYDYPYQAIPYLRENDQLVPQVETAVGRQQLFPKLPAVRFLSAQPGSDGVDNTVTVQWSHENVDVDFYRIRRNGQLIAQVDNDGPSRYSDRSGKPDHRYTYELRAGRSTGEGVDLSDPQTVEAVFPEVARPNPFTATARVDSNLVRLDWEYNGEALSGFRILRNGEVIANLTKSTRTYADYEGVPESEATYRIVALLERESMPFQSRASAAEATIPAILPPYGLSVNTAQDKGHLEIEFKYNVDGVNRFRLLRKKPGEAAVALAVIPYDYNGEEQQLSYKDVSGVPEQEYTYMVQAESKRRGQNYTSVPTAISGIVYLLPPAVNSLQASSAFENWIELQWELELNANVDGFIIYRLQSSGPEGKENDLSSIEDYLLQNNELSLLDSIVIDRSGQRQLKDAMDRFEAPPGDINYAIASFRIVEGQRFNSVLYAANGSLKDKTPALWAVNEDGKVLGWNGNSWQAYIENQPALNSVWSVSPSEAWAVGNGTVLKWDGQSWTAQEPFVNGINERLTDYNLADIWGLNQDNIWVVTGGSTGKIFKWNGTIWKEDFSTASLRSIWGANADNVWAVGEGRRIANWDGNSWEVSKVGSSSTFQSVWGTDADNVWVVNEAGETYQWDGQEWSLLTEGSYPRLHGVWSPENNLAWAVGENGIVQKWDETGLTNVDAAIVGDLEDIWGSSSDKFWVVGEGGIFRYDESSWRPESSSDGFTGEYAPDKWDIAESGETTVGFDTETLTLETDNGGTLSISIDIVSDGQLAFNYDTDSNNPVLGTASIKLNGNELLPNNESSAMIAIDATEGEELTISLGNQTNNFGPQTLSIRNFSGPFSGGDINAIAPSNPLVVSDVLASKGTFSNRTRVSWTYNGDQQRIEGFHVYRGEEQIATLNANTQFYNDSDGIPGKPYVYTVKIYNEEREYPGNADVGYTQGAGQIEGEVLTLEGNVPVEGAELTAVAVVEGERYVYETATGADGQFLLSGLYIGTESADYNLSVAYQDHGFLEPEQSFTLSPNNATHSNVVFFDTTAYAVQGQVRYAGSKCGIDSIQIVARHFLTTGQVLEESTETDEEGRYSIILKANQPNLERIEVKADPTLRRNSGQENEEVVLHDFVASTSQEIEMPVPQLTMLDFEDQQTYPVTVSVDNVCGFAASSNGRFDIEISSEDGCFMKTVPTNLTGRLTVELPPIDNLCIRAIDATPLSLENNLILNYLEYRPAMLDLQSIHIANTQVDNEGEYVLIDPGKQVDQVLVYHKPAQINLIEDFGMRPSCDPSKPRMIEQGESYSTIFSITENHQGEDCPVSEGYLVINNSAAEEQRVELEYDTNANAFPAYSFTAGDPNLVFPYRKGISIQYYSEVGDLLAERIIPVVVLGSAALPGSDIILDPKDEEGQLKFPVYILRDPPGDGSFSYIEEGETVTKTLSEFSTKRGGGGKLEEFDFTSGGVGAFLELTAVGGGSEQQTDEYQLSFTLNQRIETSSTSDFVGPDADVLVGIGMSIQYGITEQIELSDEGDKCDFQKTQLIDIAPEGIKTDWFYTVGQIKQLIQQRQNDIEAVKEGTKTIVLAGEALSADEAEMRLRAEIENWESVLRYHQVETVPYYQFCTEEYSSFSVLVEQINQSIFAGPLESSDVNILNEEDIQQRIEKAKEARQIFCEDSNVNILPTDNTLDASAVQGITFTAPLQEKYEQASRAVSLWLDSLQLDIEVVNDRIEDGLQPTSAQLPEVENTTFSAGVNVNKSQIVKRSIGEQVEQSAYLDVSVAGGFSADAESEVGTGASTEVQDFDARRGFVAEFSAEWGSERYAETTEEYTIGYLLSDDDPGDQFSVTAIKPWSTGHTPYFQLIGGRSSCPPEQGAIQRDRFDISLYDLETQSAFDFQEKRELDPNSPATFNVQLTNLNPFGEQRDLFVYHEAESNENAATLRLGGQLVGGGNESGVTLTYINPNSPVILPLELYRSPGRYQFDDIYVVMRPSCTDGDLFLTGERDTVTISAFFQHPCSDVTIAEPGNNWVINRQDPTDPDDRENLVIELVDYEAENPNLQEIQLEYRRLQGGEGWKTIPTAELEPEVKLDTNYLQTFNEDSIILGAQPRLPIVWDITDQEEYLDGDYEIRAKAVCGTKGEVYSNIIKGSINRSADGVIPDFEPADQVWVQGDEISLEVNSELDCQKINADNFELLEDASLVDVLDGSGDAVTTADGDMVQQIEGVSVPGSFGCFENKLTFTPDDQTLMPYDDKVLTLTAQQLTDTDGNIFPPAKLDVDGSPIEYKDAQGNDVVVYNTWTWDFEVIARDYYAAQTAQEITLYEGQVMTLSNKLLQSTAQGGAISFEAATDQSWLTVQPNMGQIPVQEGFDLEIEVDASQLTVSDQAYTGTITFSSNGTVVDEVTVEATVLAQPPNWLGQVNPSEYAGSMSVFANYRLSSDQNDNNISEDPMDLISAWIGNEIRGVASIQVSGDLDPSAPIVIYGNAEDEGKPLSFRVWDASAGVEYNAYPVDTLFFENGSMNGSFRNPEILIVDKLCDRARYIPVNGSEDGGPFTWISINSEEEDLSVDNMMRELKYLQEGDYIKTLSTYAQYSDSLDTWISTADDNGASLNELSPEQGYILSLSGPNDSLRITGCDAEYGAIQLDEGFNLIGFPLQSPKSLNDALVLIPTSSGIQIKTRRLRTDPGTLLTVATYENPNSGNESWLGMPDMLPNHAYLIEVGENSQLQYPGFTQNVSSSSTPDSRMPETSFDPSNPASWSVDPNYYQSSMVVVGTLDFGGGLSTDPEDKIAAFVNGTCRGVASPYQVEELGEYRAGLVVYSNTVGEEVQFLLYDASEDQVYLHTEPLSYESNGLIGTFVEPYRFESQPISAAYDITHTNCAVDSTGAIEVTFVSGLEMPYTYNWSNGATGQRLEQLSAGKYFLTITGQSGIQLMDTVAVENQAFDVPPPEIDSSVDSLACRGSDVVLYAIPPNDASGIIWYDAAGEKLQSGAMLLLENVEQDTVAYAKTSYHGCLSEVTDVRVEVYQPDPAFSITPNQGITTDTVVQFTPTVQEESNFYFWNFGNGNTSQEPAPRQQYELPGLYTTSLELADSSGCSAVKNYDLYVDAATNALELESGKLSLKAMPNPFSATLRATVEVPETGPYQLQLHNMQGQLIQQYKYDLKPDLQYIPLEVEASDGVYLLSLEHENGARVTIPVIKQFARP